MSFIYRIENHEDAATLQASVLARGRSSQANHQMIVYTDPGPTLILLVRGIHVDRLGGAVG